MGTGLLLKIGGPFVLLLAVLGYIGHLRHDRDGWKKAAVAITNELQTVGRFKGPLDPRKQGLKAVRRLGEQRDDYLRQLIDNKAALLRQTQLVLDLGSETQRLRAISAQQAEMVRKLKAERDGWIRKAERAATRTERLSAEQELRQCEEAMDALYQAGF
jgi:hypothetical protein